MYSPHYLLAVITTAQCTCGLVICRGAWPSCGQKYLPWVSICNNYLCTGGRQGMEQVCVCVCAHLCMLFTPTTSRSHVLNLWYAFIFPLLYPNIKKVVLKCSKMTAYNHWRCVPFMSVLSFVFCAYTNTAFALFSDSAAFVPVFRTLEREHLPVAKIRAHVLHPVAVHSQPQESLQPLSGRRQFGQWHLRLMQLIQLFPG